MNKMICIGVILLATNVFAAQPASATPDGYMESNTTTAHGDNAQNSKPKTQPLLADHSDDFWTRKYLTGDWDGFIPVEGWGLLPNRENDRMGVGGFYNQLSTDFKNLASVVGIDLRNLWGIEFYYNAQITPWLHITPNLQIVQNQNNSDDPAMIAAIRAVMEF